MTWKLPSVEYVCGVYAMEGATEMVSLWSLTGGSHGAASPTEDLGEGGEAPVLWSKNEDIFPSLQVVFINKVAVLSQKS